MASASAAVDVVFLDVGQGDATLVVDLETRSALLVDCPRDGESLVLELLSSYNAKLDAALVTHWDLDHFGGVLSLVEATSPTTFLYNHDTMTSENTDSRYLSALRRLCAPKNDDVQLEAAREGLKLELGNFSLELLSPWHRHVTQAIASKDRNLASAIVRIEALGYSVLIGGDADGRVWRRLIDDQIELGCDVLRYPHHGAMGHTGVTPVDELIAATDPDVVFVSVGSTNRYGHPAPSTVASIASAGAYAMCSQVTEACQVPLSAGPTSCAGTVTVALRTTGISYSPSLSAHGGRVSGWSHPICRP